VSITSDTYTGIASSGNDDAYSLGCDGGYGVRSFRYMFIYGLPWSVCYPYASGGGDPLDHFTADADEPACFETCVGDSTAGEPLVTFGPGEMLVSPSEATAIQQFYGEAAMMEGVMLR